MYIQFVLAFFIDLLDDTDQQPPADERNIDENAAERDVSAEESDDNDMSNGKYSSSFKW